MERIADILSLTAEGSGGGLHANQRGRSHLAAGHAVGRVVDEDDGEVLAAVGSVNGLGNADGSQVAVALIGVDNLVGIAALVGAGHGAGAAMGCFKPVLRGVKGTKTAAADAPNGDDIVCNAKLINDLGNQLVNGAVHTAGTKSNLRAFYHGRRSCVNLLHGSSPFFTYLSISLALATMSSLFMMTP